MPGFLPWHRATETAPACPPQALHLTRALLALPVGECHLGKLECCGLELLPSLHPGAAQCANARGCGLQTCTSGLDHLSWPCMVPLTHISWQQLWSVGPSGRDGSGICGLTRSSQAFAWCWCLSSLQLIRPSTKLKGRGPLQMCGLLYLGCSHGHDPKARLVQVWSIMAVHGETYSNMATKHVSCAHALLMPACTQ